MLITILIASAALLVGFFAGVSERQTSPTCRPVPRDRFFSDN